MTNPTHDEDSRIMQIFNVTCLQVMSMTRIAARRAEAIRKENAARNSEPLKASEK